MNPARVAGRLTAWRKSSVVIGPAAYEAAALLSEDEDDGDDDGDADFSDDGFSDDDFSDDFSELELDLSADVVAVSRRDDDRVSVL